VSDGEMAASFSERLRGEFEELARDELRGVLGGRGPIVGNLADALASLDTGRARLLPCGAGSRYLSVGADGTLFFCHRFAGDAAYAVGDVSSGVDRGRIELLLGSLSERARGCASCWARWLCGGPCFYDLDRSAERSMGPSEPRCALRKRILELGMWLYASLPMEHRERVIGAAGGRAESGLGRRRRAAVGAERVNAGEPTAVELSHGRRTGGGEGGR
jgi:radical SAM protein with 4Fe4S-binding SPASM domain